MEKITFSKASLKGVKALGRKVSTILEDKSSKPYHHGVFKFNVPEEVAKKMFSEESLQEVQSGRSTFYMALKNGCKILGFAQITTHNDDLVELDRIVVFPECERRGIETRLLRKVIADQKKGVKRIIVTAGRDEAHARAFYERNGFKPKGEEVLEFIGEKEFQ